MNIVIPPGDPGAMRAFAFGLGTWADQLESIGRDAERACGSMNFESPIAGWFYREARDRRYRAQELAEELRSQQSRLMQQADSLETEQRWARERLRKKKENPYSYGPFWSES